MIADTSAGSPDSDHPILISRPRVKPEHAPTRISGDRIRIGGMSYGVASEIRDPTGALWNLLRSMDGTRTIDEVIAHVIELHPDESSDSVRSAVKQLIQFGHIENMEPPSPPELSEREKIRYDRSLMYFRWLDLTPRTSSWEPQLLLRRAHVTVIGLGGTGGNAALALAASGVGRLHCVDYDTVELSNLNRQVLYTEDDIGRPKVDAAIDRLRRLNSDIEISGTRTQLDGIDSITSLAGECDVLLLAADRPKALRVWTNRACLSTGTPWVEAGYHGPLAIAGTFTPGEGACWECLRTAQDQRNAELSGFNDNIEPRATAFAEAVAAPSAGFSGYLAAHSVLGLLTGVAAIKGGHMHAINLSAISVPFFRDDPPVPDCPACGAGMRDQSLPAAANG